MKIDRLLALTIYLLNHKKTSASTLAKHFEVSVRTIQRDIETLCMAGIPVTADVGADGGYEILDTFSMKTQVAEQTDYAKIITALEALTSATGDKESQAVLEKMNTLQTNDVPGKEIIIDLSIAQEGTNISEKLSVIKDAVRAGRMISFEYTNAQGESNVHAVEPVYAVFQWYAWYLIAWYEEKQAYCMFKLIRMEKVSLLEKKCTRHHDPVAVREQLANQNDTREYYDITFTCVAELCTACREYLNATVIEKKPDGSALMKAHLPKNEHWWYNSLLGFGEGVTVLEPDELKEKIRCDCEKLMKKYS